MRDAKPIVFLGVSIGAEAAGEILAADYRGPVRRGDLDAIYPPASVAIIDGVLDEDERLPACEAERALQRGLSLYGAASTGALLAIEFESRGFKGFGRVFEFLRRHEGDAIDLVSVLYSARDGEVLTVPLINVILACADEGHGPREIETLTRALIAIPLDERDWDAIEPAIVKAGFSPLRSMRTANAKRDDARALLALLQSGGEAK